MARGSKAKAAQAKHKKTKQETQPQPHQERADEQQLEAAADAEQHLTAARQAVVGLSNLGNTCFFNSSVQLLLSCAPLQQMVLRKDSDITRGPLGFALQQAALHADGRSGMSKGGSSSTYNPQSLLSAVCCHAPVFKGKQQHDAHELMRMLLDGLQTQEQRYRDLSRRGKGRAALANGTAANGHSAGGPDLGTTSSSSSSSSSSAGSSRSEPTQQPDGTATQPLANGATNTTSTSSSDGSDDDTAASGGDGLDALCQAYLAKTKAASVNTDQHEQLTTSAAAASPAGGSDGAPASEASSTAADGGSDSSSCSEAAGEALLRDTSPAAAGQAQTGLEPGGCAAQPADTCNGAQHAPSSANGAASSSSTPGCRLCGSGLPPQPQSQQPLARKSLLPPEPPKSAGSSSVESVFGGVLCSSITCTACGYCSISYEPFLDLSLPIPLGNGPEEGLTRKGSLLSRLANRTTGKKKAAAAAAAAAKDAADSSTDGSSHPTAAAATAAADAAAEAAAAAAAAAAGAQGKKLNHKEKRRLQQQASKAAKEASKLARLAKKRQQEQQDAAGGSGRGDGSQAGGASPPAQQDPALFEDIPPTNYYTQEQVELMQSVKAAAAAEGQQEQQAAPAQQAEDSAAQDAGEEQQQQQPAEAVPASAAGAAPQPDAEPGPAATTSPGGWTDIGSVDASPPTAGVSCWGGGWVDLQAQRAPPAPSSIASSQAQAPPSSSSGAVPSRSDAGGPAGGSDGGSSSPKGAQPPAQQQQPGAGSSSSSSAGRSTLHRRFGSLGNLSALTSGAKGGLTSLFTGRHSRQGSRDKDALDKLAAAAEAAGSTSSSSSSGGPGQVQQRPQSATGHTSPSTERKGLKGFLLSRAPTPPPPRPASALGVVSEAGEGGAAAGGGSCTPEVAVAAAGSSSSSSTHAAAWEPTEQQAQPGVVFTPLGVVGGVSVGPEGPTALPVANGRGDAAAAAAADGQLGVGGVPVAAAAVQLPARRLQRALSDDAVMRFGSFPCSDSGSSGGGGGSRTAGGLQQHLAAKAAAGEGAGSHAGAANGVAAAQEPNGQQAAAISNPFAAPAVQQELAPPVAAEQQQEGLEAAAAAPVAPVVPGHDPFAAAAVASKGEPLAVKHCLATFFLREDVSWECPKEKALWRERRQSAASGRLSADGGRGSSADGAGSGGALCAACSQQAPQGGVAIAAHPRLQQLLEGAEDEEGPVFKQVSFSEREPQIHLVPGSVEQRGTDMAAALAGRRPFCRALTWSGASLLLTAQLGEVLGDGAAAGRQLTLALKAAGEGGVANAAAARVLPGGKAVQLGAVRLPDVAGLQLSADDSAALLRHCAQLVLNCMADLVHCEGGMGGLQAMVAGGLSLVSADGDQPALRPGYVDASSLEGRWKVRGQLPAAGPGSGAAAAAAEVTAQDSQQQLQAGYWEYPAEGSADAAADTAVLGPGAGEAHGGGSDGAASVRAGSSGCASPSASAASAAASSPAAPYTANGAGSPGQQSGSACLGWSGDAGADAGGDDMFAMDVEGPPDCPSEQQEQGPALLQLQGWQGDVLSSASSSQLGSRAMRSGSSLGSRDGEDGSTSTSRSAPLFKKVPLGAAAPAALDADTAADSMATEADGGSNGVASAPVAVPTAAAAASQPVSIRPLQGSPPPDAHPTDIAALGSAGAVGRTPPPSGSTPGSLRRSSLRRRSSSCSRTAHKSYRIFLPPQVLLLHLKRFQHDGRGRLNKLDTAVRFEFELDLSPFMADNAPSSSSSSGAATGAALEAAAGGGDGGTSSNGTHPQQQQQRQQGLMYDLVGLVVHMGTMRGGHYVAYVKRVVPNPSKGPEGSSSGSSGSTGSSAGRVQWYYVSDTAVRAVNVSEVAAAQAYMLLYVRRPGKEQRQQREAGAAASVQEQEQEEATDCGL